MMAVMVILSVSVLFTSAEETTADVYVTISSAGDITVAAEKLTVTDTNGDGALTITDALYTAHEKFYEGGAKEGYATGNTEWGLSLTKLWGVENGGSYVYYLNNDFASVFNLTTPIKSGDYVAAYSFADLKTWSDKYTYFDKYVEDVKAGEVTLTLSKADFDQDWNAISLPLEGAVITVDGKSTDIKTDAEGKAVVMLDTNGKHIVSAAYDTKTLVPPVYAATVTGGKDPESEIKPDSTEPSTQPATRPATQPATDNSKATNDSADKSGSNPNAVKTGPSTAVYSVIAMAVIAAFIAFAAKKRNEE